MSARTCWTCGTMHEDGAACRMAPGVLAIKRAGSLDDFTSPDLFDDAKPKIPTMTAAYSSLCPECWDEIEVGDTIAYIEKGWVHEECALPDEE